MENKKMVGTIEKKLGVKVEKVLGAAQEGKEVTVDVNVGGNNCRKVILKEMKNQYGIYYRLVSESGYILEAKEKAPAAGNGTSAKLRTKTERLCGARRKDIISFAEKTISSLADGTATLKEIEGPARGDTAIRFVLLLKADGSRFKEDIEISTIKSNIA